MKIFLLLISSFVFLCVSAVAQNETPANAKQLDCTIKIKVEFLKTGKIGEISFVSSTCESEEMKQKAIEAAKTIEFEPEMKNGKKETVKKTVEFAFTKIEDEQENSDANKDGENSLNTSDETLKIIYKPRASYPKPENGTICVQGMVTLRSQFLLTGEIGDVQVIKGLPHGITEIAIEAARKIKFSPAFNDGVPITVTKSVQFAFTNF